MVAVTTRLIAVASVVVGVCVSFAAVQPRVDGDRTPAGQLELASGDTYSGRMVDSDQGGVVAWQTEFADAPFLFPLDKLKSASFSPPESPKPQPGDFCFELNGGQTIFGSLVAATDESLVVESPRFGRLEIARDR